MKRTDGEVPSEQLKIRGPNCAGATAGGPELHLPWAQAPVRQAPEEGGSSTQTTGPVEVERIQIFLWPDIV